MDWKYILSLSPDNLSEDEKDQLYSAIAWFDCDSEKLDQRKYIALLKISQEVMKYKAEQVEALIAELDEIAARQGEEEVRKQESFDDLQSLKSKKSQASVDFDDLQQKFKEMKSKLKQQIKVNESQKREIQKLNQTSAILEQEKLHLQSELQSVLNHGDESQSDVSESITDQHKELVQLVQQKNKQLSQLLSDIEATETENLNLREKMSNLRDELQDATNQVTVMTNEFTSLKIKLNDNSEAIQSLKEENEALRSQVQEFVEEKQKRDNQIDEFTLAVDTRVDEWKKILQEKDEEIQRLRVQVQQASLHSSESSLTTVGDKPYIEALNKLISEREEQLVELQTQLQSATKEMDKSTQLLQQLTTDKNAGVRRIDELSNLVKDLRSQLRAAHERCQELQEGINYAESMAESKQEDLDEIVTKLKDEGQIDLSQSLEQIQKLKSQVRVKDKQITEYVKITNKLQSSVDDIENENSALRNKCGIPDDEDVNVSGVLIKKRRQSKDLGKLQKQIHVLEDEKLDLKGEVQKLNRRLSVLSSQILDSGGKLNIDSESFRESDAKGLPKHDKHDSKQQYAELVEENEALRKGLHEILDSVQARNESSRREIKSDTLEKLLRALDVRHISGWYHPAMRLQAELHTLQGVNAELREQLKIARLELNTYRHQNQNQGTTKIPEAYKGADISFATDIPQDISPSGKDMISNLNNHLLNVLNSYHEEESINSKLSKKLEEYKKNFEVTEQQLNLLYNEHMSAKKSWEDKEKEYEKNKRKFEDNIAVLDAKLKEFSNLEEDDFKKVERFAEMSGNMVTLNRKCVFLENEESKLSLEVKKLKSDLANAERATFEKMCQLRNEKNDLLGKLLVVENMLTNTVSRDVLKEVQNNLDSVTLKYRDLLNNFNAIKSEYSNELSILKETVKLLEEQKSELQSNLLDALTNLHANEAVSVSDETEGLSKKLAQVEISEITEKQRANHMSNLYRLVKEQLQKSEERLQDLEKYNQEVLHNNLILQENVKNLEDKLINFVDTKTYEDIEFKHSKSSEKIQKLVSENDRLRSELTIARKSLTIQSSSTASNDLEVLSLKHQILDLQASGDDKALIARLSSDVVHARLSETQCHKKLEELEMELKECQYNYDISESMLQQEKFEKENINAQLQQKISALELIIRHQRQQYLGSAPLISEEIFNANLQQVLKDKQFAFVSLQNIRKQENECVLLKEQLNKQIRLEGELKASLKNNTENIMADIKAWHQERNIILIKELKYRREVEFKNMQLEQISYRLNSQDELITKLQEELLRCYHKYDPLPLTDQKENIDVTTEKHEENITVKQDELKILKPQETQTTPELLNSLSDEGNVAILITNLQAKVNSSSDEIKEKNNTIEQLKSKISEQEMNISLFRTQIGDKQSQITFYEKHILELQNKISKFYTETSTVQYTNTVVQPNSDEILILKDALKKLQETNVQKNGSLLKYQTLLKRDRDEHSLAAARMQQEVKRLQDIITTQEKAFKELKESSIQHPGRAAIEQYILQVHALEKHTADLHTNVSTLNSQLQASRQEAARWQTLANDRLDSMEQLRTDLEEQHQKEIATYKRESERWREEIMKLKELISKRRSDTNQLEPDLSQKLIEKEDKIHELTMTLRHVRTEMKKHSEKSDSLKSPKVTDLESVNEQFLKEHEALKKRYEQVLNRERSAKDEIHNLKEQLIKKPISARSDKSEKEQQLQKKLISLEKEVEDLKSKLEQQTVINEAHKVAVTEDFEKWKKQKHWQQLAEKLKNKLREKSEEHDKLNQTCAGYKILIERLEREKHSLENKIKTLRNNNATMDFSRLEILNLENEKLHFENQALIAKLQMQHRHSGGLGAAMLQEKLEAQERKIAFLELTSKGSGEGRAELERLQSANENLQKINLRLEAENLELKIDLEKYGNDAPHLREQIQHLENYIEVLKTENQNKQAAMESTDHPPQKTDKKVAELERTVFVLKRVVEKLQVENKRLQGGSIRPCSSSERSSSADKIRVDYLRLKEQYGESIQKVARLEDQLKSANKKISLLEKRPLSVEIASLSDEFSRVKAELFRKSELLDKVKVLLHRAATKEKALLEEIASLKLKISPEICSPGSSLT